MAAESIQHPLVVSDVTSDWLTSVLREAGILGDERIVDLEVVPFGSDRGLVCVTARLVPVYEPKVEGTPESFVLKMPNFVQFHDEVIQSTIGRLVASEAYWYRDLRPDCTISTPRCYWHSVDEAARKSWILLEDLSQLRVTDQATGLTLVEAELAVEGLAGMHARWWEDARVRGLPWITGPEYQGDYWQGQMEANWEASLRLFGRSLDPALGPLLGRLAGATRQIIAEAADSASTLVHGDFRAENFLFGSQGDQYRLAVLDWQFVHWGSGLRDLGYLLSQNLGDEARVHEADLADHYYERLRERGVRHYSRDQFEADYRRGLLLAFSIPLSGGAIMEEMFSAGPGDVDDEAREQWQAYWDSVIELFGRMCTRSADAAVARNAFSVLPSG